MDGTILIADDDRTIRTILSQVLIRAGCTVRATTRLNTLWAWIKKGQGDAVILDVILPDGNGLQLLPKIQRQRPDLPVIIISAHSTVMTAVQAVENNAYDYFSKPFDVHQLLLKTHKALTQKQKTKQQDLPTAHIKPLPLIGSSAIMQKIYRCLARILNINIPVIIFGETGTGKNLLARNLHDLSDRKYSDFITLSAAFVVAEELKSKVAGAKTRSSLYFDAIDEMPRQTQANLLQLLQKKAFISKDLRIICSICQQPSEIIRRNILRQDLFYRLNGIAIELPALRNRADDIPELVQYFLEQAAISGLPHKTIAAKAIDLISTESWLGNVLQLKNFIKTLVVLVQEYEISVKAVKKVLEKLPRPILNSQDVRVNDLSTVIEPYIKLYCDLYAKKPLATGLYNPILQQVERPLIAHSLRVSYGNQTKAARLLGINRNTLRKKIQQFDILPNRDKRIM